MEQPELPPVPPVDPGPAPAPRPSATERRLAMELQQKRRRRRGFLLGLLAGQVLIIALDLGGTLFLKTHPQVKLQAPVGVASVVFLGMAAGAALMLTAIALLYGVMALRGLCGIRRLLQSGIAMTVTIGVIIGTAWFMIPHDEWKPTALFAREQGVKLWESSKAGARSMFR
jgi:hypothetical protein